jgi:predicted GTPase
MSGGRLFWLRWWLEVVAAVLLLAPMIVLLTAGTAWLWEHGWLLWWLLAAASVTAIVWVGLRFRHREIWRPPGQDRPTLTNADPTWAPHEQAAWQTVRRFSNEAEAATLADHRLMLAAAKRAIEAVARHYHPEHVEPALEFTLPELLLLTERVSARLRLVLLEQVPLSHRLKARSLIRAWGLRPMLAAGFERGRKLYSFVRVARAASPLHALVAEVRDHLVGDLFDRVQTNVQRRVVRLWIEEVGRAAIELYSGRLNVDAIELAAAAARDGLAGAAAVAPGSLRLLVAGGRHAGKSRLVRAMLGELGDSVDVTPLTTDYEGYELRRDGLPLAYVIDSPAVNDDAQLAEFVKRAFVCDLIVWVTPAHAPDLARDRAALDALRERFAANPQRRMPPLIVVASQIDRLVPTEAWSPPYSIDAPATRTEQVLHRAVDELAAGLLVPIDAVVPMRLDVEPPYNLDLLWLRFEALAEEAQLARWVRVLRRALEKRGWRSAWRQAAGARRIVGRLLRR